MKTGLRNSSQAGCGNNFAALSHNTNSYSVKQTEKQNSHNTNSYSVKQTEKQNS
ncbi:MAG: hypothetical protein HZB65_00220, partial [Candidatus Aenigmarchaeota archaeon]|nr:hypothetical protein [Candidatus Aenigmarchaeota archaeon]